MDRQKAVLDAAARGELAPGPKPDLEYRWKCKDGEYRWFSDSRVVASDEQGRIVALVGAIRDIDERKRIEQAIRDSEARLKYVIDNTRDIIFQMNLRGDYIFANPVAEEVTGYTLDELLRMNMRDLVAPEHLPRIVDRLRRRTAGEDLSQPFRFDIRHKDGRRLTMELVTSPLIHGGRLVGIQGIARDITERERAQAAIQAAHKKLMAAREEERRRLAADLHDSIGQEMVALKVTFQSLIDPDRGIRDRQAYAEAVGRCDALIREVRNISHGLYPATLEGLGLTAALRQLVQQIERSGIEPELDTAGELEAARFHPDVEIALFRIAQEAANNAIRHSGARRVALRLHRDERRLALSICDDGEGFDPDAVIGKGLGLNSMEERASAVGGQLRIDSAPGHTCIRATVPVDARD
jgi:PAS domain S-box-containing protein